MVHRPMPGGGSLATYDDVTRSYSAERQLRFAKEEAELASRAKSDFLANVSHELRTPLNAIIGFSEIIKDQLFGPMGNQRYREYAIDIHDSGTHLLSLINDLLARTEERRVGKERSVRVDIGGSRKLTK